MRLLSSLVIVLAVALASTAEAKGKGKGKGKGGKPATIEKKVKKDKPQKVKGKKAGKHDLDSALKGKGKAKGKGKGLEKGTPDEAKAAKEAGAEPAATEDMSKPGPKGHAWGKNKHFLELRKHLQRMAKLRRLEEIAKEKKNDNLLTRIQALRTKETERHTRTLAKVDAKESIKDVKEAAKDAKKAVKEAKKAE
jgi:hypothetical protein